MCLRAFEDNRLGTFRKSLGSLWERVKKVHARSFRFTSLNPARRKDFQLPGLFWNTRGPPNGPHPFPTGPSPGFLPLEPVISSLGTVLISSFGSACRAQLPGAISPENLTDTLFPGTSSPPSPRSPRPPGRQVLPRSRDQRQPVLVVFVNSRKVKPRLVEEWEESAPIFSLSSIFFRFRAPS